MNSTKSVWHRNGSGGEYSPWYQDAHGLTDEQAEAKQIELEAQEHNGWYSKVRIFDDEVNPNDR